MDRNPTLHHAQCQIDLATVRDMLQDEEPNMESLVNVGGLLIRYSGVSKESAATEILAGLNQCLDKWEMTRSELNTACFKIWNSGYRPGSLEEELTVGSGAS